VILKKKFILFSVVEVFENILETLLFWDLSWEQNVLSDWNLESKVFQKEFPLIYFQ